MYLYPFSYTLYSYCITVSTHILKAIEERAPFLQKQREDYQRSLDAIHQLTLQLEMVMTASVLFISLP